MIDLWTKLSDRLSYDFFNHFNLSISDWDLAVIINLPLTEKNLGSFVLSTLYSLLFSKSAFPSSLSRLLIDL